MGKWKRKPVFVEADPFSETLLGVSVNPIQIVFSVDRRWYYVQGGTAKPDRWISADDTDTRQLPFVFWEFKVGDRTLAYSTDPIVLRYAKACGWEQPPVDTHYCENHGVRSACGPGDWIVRFPDGSKLPMSDAELRESYDPVEEGSES